MPVKWLGHLNLEGESSIILETGLARDRVLYCRVTPFAGGTPPAIYTNPYAMLMLMLCSTSLSVYFPNQAPGETLKSLLPYILTRFSVGRPSPALPKSKCSHFLPPKPKDGQGSKSSSKQLLLITFQAYFGSGLAEDILGQPGAMSQGHFSLYFNVN